MEKIQLAINIGMGLVSAATEIFQLVNGKTDITDEELKAIIDKANVEQADARAKLAELLGK